MTKLPRDVVGVTDLGDVGGLRCEASEQNFYRNSEFHTSATSPSPTYFFYCWIDFTFLFRVIQSLTDIEYCHQSVRWRILSR